MVSQPIRSPVKVPWSSLEPVTSRSRSAASARSRVPVGGVVVGVVDLEPVEASSAIAAITSSPTTGPPLASAPRVGENGYATGIA